MSLGAYFGQFVAFVFAAQAAFAAIDRTLIAVAPSSSTVLAGIDVQRAETFHSGSLMLKRVIEDQGVAKLVASIGLDVRRDLHHLLLVGFGQRPVSEAQTILIGHGTFDPARLISAGRLRGASIKRFDGFTVIIEGAGANRFAVAFPKPGVLLMGNLARVQAALAPTAHWGRIGWVLREQVNQIGPGHDVWFATTLSGSFLAETAGHALPSRLHTSGALGRISRSLGGVEFGRTDKVVLNLTTRSPGDARFLARVLELAGVVARLPSGGNAGLVLAESVLTSMRLSIEYSTVHLVSTVPDGELERAFLSRH